jgi:DNA-binding transcriptional ArsR family regulator
MSIDHLSTTFSALADPTRRAILARLALGEASVAELSQPFSISPPAVTKHLKVLQRAGLITQGRQAQWRPCKLQAAPLHEAADFIAQYRQFWEQSLDRLDTYLQTLQAQEKKNHGKKHGK